MVSDIGVVSQSSCYMSEVFSHFKGKLVSEKFMSLESPDGCVTQVLKFDVSSNKCVVRDFCKFYIPSMKVVNINSSTRKSRVRRFRGKKGFVGAYKIFFVTMVKDDNLVEESQ